MGFLKKLLGKTDANDKQAMRRRAEARRRAAADLPPARAGTSPAFGKADASRGRTPSKS